MVETIMEIFVELEKANQERLDKFSIIRDNLHG